MERGSRVIIYKLKEITPKKGNKFYSATLIESIHNNQKPFNKGIEQSFVSACIFDTSVELKPATWGDGKHDKKFSFENVTNPEESIFRIEDCDVQVRTKWKNGWQVKENGLPATETIAFISKLCKEKEYKSDAYKEKVIENKIAKLESTIEKIKVENRAKVKELRNTIKKLNKQIERQNEMINEARVELDIIPERNLTKKTRVREYDDVFFEDM